MSGEMLSKEEVQKIQSYVAVANDLVIINQQNYDLASKGSLQIKTQMAQVEAALDPQCKAAYTSWQIALNQKKHYLTPLEEALKIVKRKMGDYEIKQEQERQLEQAKLCAAAEKEEEERKKELDKKIAKAEKKGDTSLVDILELEKDTMALAPVIVPTLSKMNGLSSSNDYDVTITDAKAFLKAVIIGKIQINLDKIITWKLGGIKIYIKTTGTETIPGLLIVKTKNVSVRVKNGDL